MSNQHMVFSRSLEHTTSAQDTNGEPSAKRQREDEEPSIQEVSEIMKMLLENNPDIDADQIQTKTTTAPNIISSEELYLPKGTQIIRGPPKQVQQGVRPLTIGRKPIKILVSPPVPQGKSSEKPKFNCAFCPRMLTTQGRIKKHEEECDQNPNRKTIICEVCKMELKPSSLGSHMGSKHGKKVKPTLPLPLTTNSSNDEMKTQHLLTLPTVLHPSTATCKESKDSPDSSLTQEIDENLPEIHHKKEEEPQLKEGETIKTQLLDSPETVDKKTDEKK